jgi:DNA-binding MarR family transcriptional regulator
MASGREASLGSMPSKFLKALERLQDTHADLTVRQLRYLMFVAEHPGLTVAEVYRALGSHASIASRTFAILSDVGTPKVEGLGFVDMRPDEKDRRLRRLFLSAKGGRFLADLRKDLGL